MFADDATESQPRPDAAKRIREHKGSIDTDAEPGVTSIPDTTGWPEAPLLAATAGREPVASTSWALLTDGQSSAIPASRHLKGHSLITL